MKNILFIRRRIQRSFSIVGRFNIAGLTCLTSYVLGLLSFPAYSQQGEWAWMKGFNGNNGAEVYGTLGVPDTSNTPPAVYEPAEWKDSQERFWFFGGRSANGENNALWMYDKQINSWTWEGGSIVIDQPGTYGTQGIPSISNCPGARAWGAPTWVDHDGNLWLFGGLGYDSNGNYGELNDLWRYNISTQEWTWISGSNLHGQSGIYGTQGVPDINNRPGSRHECNASWVDDSNALWFLGGYNGSCWNDLWRFNISTNEWTWMKGANYSGQTGVYGTLGVPSSSNIPGARAVYCKWRDTQNNFWMFGGYNFSTTLFNDLWKYDPSTNEWTWMSGTNLPNNQGTYSSICDSTSANCPKSRLENRACGTDLEGKFWLFGGTSDGSAANILDDLWYYKPSTNEWTWASGSSGQNGSGAYGTKGIASTNNSPPAYMGSIAWIDDSCNLWLFGGVHIWYAYKSNTLWKYIPGCGACKLLSIINLSASDTFLCENYCINFTDQSSNNPSSWQWIFNGGSPDTSSIQNPTNICYSVPGTYDVVLITTNANGVDTLILPAYITVNALPSPPVISQSNDTLMSSVASGYQWFMNGSIIPGATNQQLIITQSGDYSVTISDSVGCPASDSIAAVLFLPQGDFTSNEVSGCPNSCFDFINASLNAITYQWFFIGGNPSTSTQQDPSNICYANPGVFDVMLIASSNFASDTLLQSGYITIFTPIVVSISQNGNSLTCNPAASSYQWWLNGNQVPGATSQTLIVTQPGTYTVEVIDSNGCSSSAIINVTNLPSSNFSVSDTTLCEKFCINFNDESTNNPTSWQWIFPGGDPANSTLQNPSNVCYQNPGIFDVTLITTDSNGISDTLTLTNYITVYTNPFAPVITQNGNTLTSSSASSYQWQLNSVDIPGATNQSYTITQSGLYTVVIGDENSCKAQSSVDASFVGIESVGENFSVNIYPNPSDGSFMVELVSAFMADEISISVVNMVGQKIFSSIESRSIGTSAAWRQEINLYATSGVYFFEIKSQNIFLKKKIIITN
ncbi:MAG TPA: PKD domain-containing protein [Chitinophagales bacterium]|nr:PKD domain-containing protein [Chitinophagales bacterium]